MHVNCLLASNALHVELAIGQASKRSAARVVKEVASPERNATCWSLER